MPPPEPDPFVRPEIPDAFVNFPMLNLLIRQSRCRVRGDSGAHLGDRGDLGDMGAGVLGDFGLAVWVVKGVEGRGGENARGGERGGERGVSLGPCVSRRWSVA